MNKRLNQLIFQVMRSFVIEDSAEGEFTSYFFAKAMTMNENLKSYGYTLTPEDIIKVSKLKVFQEGQLYLDAFIKEYEPEIKTDPMYPDFPQQVLEMSDVALLFDQMMHYISFALNEANPETAHIKAWLPPVEKTKKTNPDKKLLEAKRVSLISEKEFIGKLEELIHKRERWSTPEQELIRLSIHLLKDNHYSLGFKENLQGIMYDVLITQPNIKKARKILQKFAQNPMDVLDTIEYIYKGWEVFYD